MMETLFLVGLGLIVALLIEGDQAPLNFDPETGLLSLRAAGVLSEDDKAFVTWMDFRETNTADFGAFLETLRRAVNDKTTAQDVRLHTEIVEAYMSQDMTAQDYDALNRDLFSPKPSHHAFDQAIAIIFQTAPPVGDEAYTHAGGRVVWRWPGLAKLAREIFHGQAGSPFVWDGTQLAVKGASDAGAGAESSDLTRARKQLIKALEQYQRSEARGADSNEKRHRLRRGPVQRREVTSPDCCWRVSARP